MINHNNFPFNNPYLNLLQNQQMVAERNMSQNQGTVFIPVHSDNEVISYPVAPGNSVYFKHETEPRIYIKTMGMSQFDTPKMTRYKLVEETMDGAVEEKTTEPTIKYFTEEDFKPISDEIKALHNEVENIKAKLPKESLKTNMKPTDTKEK